MSDYNINKQITTEVKKKTNKKNIYNNKREYTCKIVLISKM